MMTTNPKFRRQGINAHLIKQLRTEFGVSQEDVIFDKPTKQGKLFEISKKYNLGGETDRNFNDKELLRRYKNEESIGFTAIAHLKSKGLIPRADGQKRKSEKYMEYGGLIAPNGKASNLTPEQYKLVRTKAFKDWFGDWENDPENSSKVVDENGEPLVMYHGTQNTFTIFEMDYIETGIDDKELKSRFWFTKNKELAESYSRSRVGDSKVYELFLNIRKPKNNDFNLYTEDDNDGVIEYNGRKNISVAIVTSSNQIKLADGTNTTFDGNNPDIRFEKGGVMSYREYVDSQFNEETDKYLPSGYLQEFEILRDKKDLYPILYRSKNGFDYRIQNNTNSQISVFDGDKMIGYADNKAIMVAPSYQKKGIGLELVTILKERNPEHRFGSMTPEGWNLLGKYYDEKIAKKSNSTFAKGGRTIAQTPAPASDRVFGSKTNPKGSASDTQLAKSIKFNDSLLKAIENKVKAHNEEYPSKKVTLPTAKAVVRRGMGAYSKSHRPFITGGAPNSRQAWGLARLNKFLLKKRGVKVKSAYIQDDDLL
jgi:GNAT superfamily N-acetyltransferase